MDLERLEQLEQIVLLSREMLKHAGQNDWARVAELEADRRKLVNQCFQQFTRLEDTSDVAPTIQEILHLNQEVMKLGAVHRESVGADMHRDSLGRTARAAYLGCAR
ncbi:MAG: flagellar protein FliT [Thiogranum sp.]|nr:flagellar protein FliT [Thiogranum sp.]